MADRPPYLQPPVDLFTDDRLTDGDCTVYCLLLSFADFGTCENCHPSAATVAKRGKRGRTAVVKSLTRLVATGWVTRSPRRSAEGDQDSSLYAFPRQAGLYPKATDPVSESDRPCIPERPTVVSESDRRVVSQSDHYLEPENREPVTERIAPAALTLDLQAPKPKQRKPKAQAQEDKPKAPKATFAEASILAALWSDPACPARGIAKIDARNIKRPCQIVRDTPEAELRALFDLARTHRYWSGNGASTPTFARILSAAGWDGFCKDVRRPPQGPNGRPMRPEDSPTFDYPASWYERGERATAEAKAIREKAIRDATEGTPLGAALSAAVAKVKMEDPPDEY